MYVNKSFYAHVLCHPANNKSVFYLCQSSLGLGKFLSFMPNLGDGEICPLPLLIFP